MVTKGEDEGRGFRTVQIGSGRVVRSGEETRFVLDPTNGGYSNAQIDNYTGLRRSQFPCEAPIRLSLRAWASHEAAALRGTWGFGFWNQPYLPGGGLPRLPRYVWFFGGGSPHHMAFVRGVPGDGWKASTADFTRPGFVLLAPGAPLGFLLMRVPGLYRRLWGIAQTAIGAAEAVIPQDLRQPQGYTLEWLRDRVCFYVGKELILESPFTPRGKLGLVIWMDNQYAIITPQGKFGFGLVSMAEKQWLAVDELQLERL